MAKSAYVYWDLDDEPWAVLVDGHVSDRYFLRLARAVAEPNCIRIEGKIERRYIRQTTHEDAPDRPWWDWCDGRLKGAQPVTVIVAPPLD